MGSNFDMAVAAGNNIRLNNDIFLTPRNKTFIFKLDFILSLLSADNCHNCIVKKASRHIPQKLES